MNPLNHKAMKNLINLFFATILIASTSAFAHAETNIERLNTADGALNLYVETVTQGQTSYANELFSEQFRQTTSNQSKAIRHNKQEVVAFLKGNKNIKQNCTTNYDILEASTSYALARVEMKYEGFSKIDLVSLSMENGSWKVDQVISSYHE